MDMEFEKEIAENRKIILSGLNERQSEAVSLGNESCLVLAGAGSGKTSVLTKRIAYLVNDGIDPESILAVTFTNKAAEEMKKRLKKIIGREAVDETWMGTFHSLCNRILREEYRHANLPKDFVIIDTDDQESVVRNILKDIFDSGTHGKDSLETDDGKKIKPSNIVSWINKQKEQGLTPSEVDVDEKHELHADCYAEYQRVCANQGLLDFSDLLNRCVHMLENNQAVRDKYRHKFKTILVDEFQDTNDIQYRWLQLIKGGTTFVMAVGDDDQSIYGFRGANPENMRQFVKEMATKNGKENIIRLEQNYRSLPFILESANNIISQNRNRLGKNLWSSHRDNQDKIKMMEYQNAFTEAQDIAKQIHASIKSGVNPSEIAVLYRSNSQSRLIETELNKLALPVTVYGGYRFYDRQEVKLILSYLDVICNFDRDISFSKVVNTPPRGIGERTIEDLRQEAREAGNSMIKQIIARSEAGGAKKGKQAILEEFVGSLFTLSEDSYSMSLSALMDKVVSSMKIDEHYKSGDDFEERMSNISELVSAAKQFEIENPDFKTAADALPEYLSFIALMTSTSESDMNKKNTVSLMTVHAAKGLEFDSVFVIGLEEEVFPSPHAVKEEENMGNGRSIEDAYSDVGVDLSSDDFEDQEYEGSSELMQEERRLMYVAVTRARKNLNISMARKKLVYGEEKSMMRSRFIDEIPRHRIETKIEPKGQNQSGKKPWFNKKSTEGFQTRIISENKNKAPSPSFSSTGSKPAEIEKTAVPAPSSVPDSVHHRLQRFGKFK